MKFSVVDIKGDKKEEVSATPLERELDSGLLHTNYLVERYQRAIIREGSASTKTKAEVSGGGAKPYKQKGTGHARRGSNRTPLRPGGGISFGPKPRNYEFKLNRKTKKLAVKTLLSEKQNQIVILSENEDQLLKTAQVARFLMALKVSSEQKVLFVLNLENDLFLARAARNLPNVNIALPHSVPMSIAADADLIVISQSAYATLQEKVFS